MNKLTTYKQKVQRWVAWALLGLGAFILNYGIFGMAWFEDSIIHKSWNKFLESVVPTVAESGAIESSLQLPAGTGGVMPWFVFAGIISIVILWDAFKSVKKEK